MLYDKLIEYYLDYFNNYLTIEKFAEHHCIKLEHAYEIIAIGRYYYHEGPEL